VLAMTIWSGLEHEPSTSLINKRVSLACNLAYLAQPTTVTTLSKYYY